MRSFIRTRRAPRLVAVATAAMLVFAACGSDNGDEASDGSDATTTDQSAPAIDTGAATLRAGLTNLLQEHVYLAGTATGTAIAGGNFDAAAATLDVNTVALSEAIASVYGEEAGDRFLELWRTHIGFFVDYTNAAVMGDEAARQAALDELDGYVADIAAFLTSANPEVDEDVVVESFSMHIDTLIAAIDAQAAGDPQQFTLLRTAAQHMPAAAEYLATVIVAQMPDEFS